MCYDQIIAEVLRSNAFYEHSTSRMSYKQTLDWIKDAYKNVIFFWQK